MRKLIVLIAILVPLASGCSPRVSGAAQPNEAPPSRCAVTRTVVVGLDRSGSYSLAGRGAAQVATLLDRAACPGDTWYLRWIEEDSYQSGAAITTVAFAPVPPQPTRSANPLARRERAAALGEWDRLRQAFVVERSKASAAVRALQPAVAGGTDVVGFLMKADTLMADAPARAQRVVVMTTDLQHNVDRDGTFALHGAHVLLLVFQADDPTLARELRTSWQERLIRSGASAVTFRDAMEPADHVLDAPAVAPRR